MQLRHVPFNFTGNKPVRYAAHSRTAVSLNRRTKETKLAHRREDVMVELCTALRTTNDTKGTLD